MTDESKATKAVSIALQTEKDGLDMYEQAAARAGSPAAERMFESLADDERNHIRIIQAHIEGEGIGELIKKAQSDTAAGQIKTIFTDAKKTIQSKAAATEDDKQALKLAMDFEKKGYDYYTEAAQNATEPVEKDMFLFLKGIENQHYEILQRALQYLEDTGHWFLWQEGGPIEG